VAGTIPTVESPTVASGTWRVRPYRDAGKPSILRLSAQHDQEREGGHEQYIDWLYHTTPAGRPLVIVGEDVRSGDVVGFLWSVPFQIKVGPELYRA
jgi:hypothetical protein